MVTINTDDLTIVLEKLASQASLTTLMDEYPVLPSGWDVLVRFKNSNTLPGNVVPIPSQGFLAKGPDGNAALALGVTWTGYLLRQFDGQFLQKPLAKEIAGNNVPAAGQLMSIYVDAYQDLRKVLWNSLSQLGNRTLSICGMGLGAPLAQIAALDLRPGNTGPDKQDAPSKTSPCYVFSAGNIANETFADYYNGLIKESYRVLPVKADRSAVDLFPDKPSDVNFSPLGELQGKQAAVPDKIDVPWWIRSDVFYLQMLGGTPIPADPSSTYFSPNPLPAGFSQDMAFTLTQLTAAAYKMAQRPGSAVDYLNYKYTENISSNDTPFAYVFNSEGDGIVVVVFRGDITWDEFNRITADSNVLGTSFNPTPSARVHKGAYSLYTAPAKSGTTTPTFSAALRTAIRKVLTGNKKLYLAGHGLGGAIANLAAADYTMSSDKLSLTAVYTFGTTLVGTHPFKIDFEAFVGSKSYQIRRLNDKIPNATIMRGFVSFENQIILGGDLDIDESTFHSLYGYLKLIDPSRPPVPGKQKK